MMISCLLFLILTHACFFFLSFRHRRRARSFSNDSTCFLGLPEKQSKCDKIYRPSIAGPCGHPFARLVVGCSSCLLRPIFFHRVHQIIGRTRSPHPQMGHNNNNRQNNHNNNSQNNRNRRMGPGGGGGGNGPRQQPQHMQNKANNQNHHNNQHGNNMNRNSGGIRKPNALDRSKKVLAKNSNNSKGNSAAKTEAADKAKANAPDQR